MYSPPFYEVDPGQSIQAAIDAASAAGGGEVVLRPGLHQYDVAPRLRSNVHLHGSGVGITILAPAVNGVNGLDGAPVGERIANVAIDRLTVRGRFDVDPTPGGDNDRGIKVERVDGLRIRDVEVIYARNMGLTTHNSVDVIIENCRVAFCSRDGVNATGSRAARIGRNYVHDVGDDAIALHDGNLGAWGVIEGNVIEHAHGIKSVGLVDITIANNILRSAHGYGLAVYTTVTEGNHAAARGKLLGNSIVGVVPSGTVSRGLDLQFGAFDAHHFEIAHNGIYGEGAYPGIENAIRIDGTTRSFNLVENTIVNAQRGVYYAANCVPDSALIARNRFERTANAIVATPLSPANLRLYVQSNVFDLDPLSEIRSGGSWPNTTDGAALYLLNSTGVYVNDNHFWNYQKTAHGNAATVIAYGQNWKNGVES